MSAPFTRCVLLGVLGLALSTPTMAAPLQLHHQGRLMDATGVPYTGAHTIGVTLFDAETNGNLLWSAIDVGSLSIGGVTAGRITDAFGSDPDLAGESGEATIVVNGVQLTSGRFHCNGTSIGTVTYDDAFSAPPAVIVTIGEADGNSD